MEKIARRESLVMLAMAVLLALALLVVPGSAAELHVGAGQPYTSIQAAINAADTVNNTIIVHNGTYEENLVVNKSNIVIRSDNGSSVTNISSNTTDTHVVKITGQTNVTLEGFTIQDANGTTNDVAGIYLNNATGCAISNTIVTNMTGKTAYGIRLSSSSNNTFSSSTSVSSITASGTAIGISLLSAENNTFSANTSVSSIRSTNGEACGIKLYISSNNTFTSNTSVYNVNGTYAYGIALSSSRNNAFSASTSVSTITSSSFFSGVACGISLISSSNNNFSAGTSVSYVHAHTSAIGIDLYKSNNNRFNASTFVSNVTTSTVGSENAYGISLESSSNNNLFESTSVSSIRGGNAYGISLTESSNNNTFSASTSVSSISGCRMVVFGFSSGDAYGIYLSSSSDNNTFSASTSVSTVEGCMRAYGIYLSSSSNNGFNASTSVSSINASFGDSCGISLESSSRHNRFSSNTTVSNITATFGDACGIYLSSSSNNTFSASTSVSSISAGGVYFDPIGFYLSTCGNNANGIFINSSSNSNTFSGSTSVSHVMATATGGNLSIPCTNGTAKANACGIYLKGSSNNNTFNSSVSVSNVTATAIWLDDISALATATANAYGIRLSTSSNNNTFNSSTSVSNVTATATGYYDIATTNAYGIYLQANSDANTFTRVTIAPTINGNESYEFYSATGCDDNVVTDLTIGNSPTTISFTYGNGIWLKRVNVSERPGDPGHYRNISKYINASNLTANSWLFVNFSYSENDLDGTGISGENTLKVWKYNGTAWNEDGWSESRVLDTSKNVVGVNITSFCIFAPLGNSLTPPTITSFAPPSPVNDTVCTRRTFNVTVNQTVNVSWYLNGTPQFTNVTVREANCTLHAAWPGEHNVSAIATNQNGTVMQTWIWNIPVPPTITSFAPPSSVNDTVCTWRTFNVTVNQPVNMSWYLNGTLQFTNVTVREANCTLHAEWPGEHNVSAIATNQNGTVMQTWIWNVTGLTSVTIPTATGTGNATINTSSGYFCDIPVALNDSYFLGNMPESALTFPYGFFNFSICGLNTTIPETVTINFTFPSAIPTNAEFWKYNSSDGTWYQYDFGDNDGDNVISITITDNGAGDHNPANGTITDPNTIGWSPTAAVPALTPLGLVALMGLLSAVAAKTITKRKRR
jgi:hypothetical protein